MDSKEKLLPGTAIAYLEPGEKGFSKIEMLLEATGGLSLSQVCAVTGLETSTIQNWVKRGWVSHPKGKKYEEVHIARILIINALKECIKLEHIALLMSYVNGPLPMPGGVNSVPGNIGSDPIYRYTPGQAVTANYGIIKESELFNYLCEALKRTGQVDDLSRSGVESVVEKVIKDYNGPNPDSRIRIRKALTLMIYACVCTDVKRRTEAMMGQILYDLENPDSVAAEAAAIQETSESGDTQPEEQQPAVEIRKTVSQALREWDINSVERIISEQDEEEKDKNNKANQNNDSNQNVDSEEKTSYRPWYFRKNTK